MILIQIYLEFNTNFILKLKSNSNFIQHLNP